MVLMICFITIIFASINMCYAKSNTIWEVPDKTLEFEYWENLQEEEKEKTIIPEFSNRTLENSIKKSEYNNILNQKRAALESNYRRPAITVKDQKQTGNCWAFSFSSVLEGTGKGRVYSPFY